MGKTVAEKIFSIKSGKDCYADDVIDAKIDCALTNDAAGPLMIDYFNKMGADRVFDPEKIVAIIDHYVPCPNQKVAGLHQSLFDFQKKYGIRIIDGGEGIAHQLFDEERYVVPGSLIVGSDSHTTTHGYLGNIAIGVGASDLAYAIYTGELWFKVPRTIQIEFVGKPNRYVTGKDVALHLMNVLGDEVANYRALEFCGEGLKHLSIDDRKTICNLCAECCAKCAIMPVDEIAEAYCNNCGISIANVVFPDSDCHYENTIQIDLSEIPNMVAVPHNVIGAMPAEQLDKISVDMAVMGTCTNGRLQDFLDIEPLLDLEFNRFVMPVLVIPASRRIEIELYKRGIAEKLLRKHAMILPPSCGPCCGSSPGVPRDGFHVISTANRNFLGRMGNTKADIYLASPLVVIASAITGKVTRPEELLCK